MKTKRLRPLKRIMETSAASARAKAKLQGKVWEGDKLDERAIGKFVMGALTLLAKDSSGMIGQDGDEWEDFVFLAATKFTASLFVGRGQHQTEEFDNPLQAMDRALEMAWNGRQCLAYALAPSGRQVCLARQDWPRYRLMWAAKLKCLGMRNAT